jgi:hypothetical protein
MSVSQSSIGLQLYPRYNSIAWTQPLGKGTAVLPAQANNSPFTAFPVPGNVIDEVGMSLWHLGCGHGIDVIRIFKDFDTDTQTQCAVVACSVCSYIQRIISPYEDATINNPPMPKYPIIVP